MTCTHCGATFRGSPKGLGICKADRQRAYARFRATYGHLGPVEWQREFNRIFGSREAVLALLAPAYEQQGAIA